MFKSSSTLITFKAANISIIYLLSAKKIQDLCSNLLHHTTLCQLSTEPSWNSQSEVSLGVEAFGRQGVGKPKSRVKLKYSANGGRIKRGHGQN